MCAKNSVRQALDAAGELFFSLSELQKLVEQENSCVSVVSAKRSITLMPLHLQNLKASIKDILKAKVNRYDVQLEGIILAHKNVKLMVNNILLSDSQCFHLEYLADIYVFTPKVGGRLIGTVNKFTNQYVNILVHGIFNVSVFPSGCQEVGDLEIGCQVVVKVTALDYTGRIPFIKASIISSDNDGAADTANSKKMKKRSKRHEEEQNSLIGISQREEQSSLIGVSQRKGIVSILKNSPLRIQQSSTEAESSSTESTKARTKVDTPPAVEGETPKKKKKKKSKTGEVVLGEKPSKKRKRGEDDGSDSVSPKKKKKKDKHKDKETEGDQTAEKTPLENTVQILADESIFQAASSTPVLGPPPSPKKKKERRSVKAEHAALVESVLKLKIEEIMSSGSTEAMDTSLNSSDVKDKSKSKKTKIKQEEAIAYQNTSSLADANRQESSGKKKHKKKKDKDLPVDDLAKSIMAQSLKAMKGEV